MIRTIRLSDNAYEPRATIGGGTIRDRMPYEGATDYVTDGARYGIRYEDGHIEWMGDSLERAFGGGVALAEG